MYKWLILPILFRFDAEQVHHGRVEVMHRHRLLDDVVAELVGLAVLHARAHAGAGQERREAARMVVATVVFVGEIGRSAALPLLRRRLRDKTMARAIRGRPGPALFEASSIRANTAWTPSRLRSSSADRKSVV